MFGVVFLAVRSPIQNPLVFLVDLFSQVIHSHALRAREGGASEDLWGGWRRRRGGRQSQKASNLNQQTRGEECGREGFPFFPEVRATKNARN